MKKLSSVNILGGLTVNQSTILSGTVSIGGIGTGAYTSVLVRNGSNQLLHRSYNDFVSDITTSINLSNYVPVTRTLTINGTTYDLSANRTWTIANSYISNVALANNALTFTGVNSGFNGTISLDPVLDEVKTVYERVKNVSGGLIVKGTPLAVVPGQTSGNLSDVIPADAADPTKMPAVYIANENMADQAEGQAILFGFLQGVDTSLYPSGTTVYVAAGGGWTATKPVHPNKIQNLGVITKQHPSNGSGVVTGVGRANDLPNLTAGKIWVGSPTYPIESTTVHIDEANGRVGIGTTSPSGLLHLYQPSGTGNFILSRTNNITGVNFQLSTDSTKVRINGYGDGLTFWTAAAGVGTNAVERMRIDSSGNVGIGTTNPATTLDVVGAVKSSVAFQANVNESVDADNLFNNGIKYGFLFNTAANLPTAGNSHYSNLGNILLTHYDGATTDDFYIRAKSYNGLTSWNKVWTDQNLTNVSQLANDAGYITSASAGLDQATADTRYVNVTGDTMTGNLLPGTDSTLRLGNDTNRWLKVHTRGIRAEGNTLEVQGNAIQFYNGTNIGMFLSSSGNVGIGTTSPNSYAGYTALTLDHPTSGGIIDLEKAGTRIGSLNVNDGNFNIVNPIASDMLLFTSFQERLRITAAGNVGIGTTSPVAPLHVYKSDTYSAIISRADWNIAETRLGLGAQYGVLGYISTSIVETTNDTSYIALNYKNGLSTYAEGLRVYNNGNVGIGTTSPEGLLQISRDASTAYDGTNDSGQSEFGASLTIQNTNTTLNSFAQVNMQVSSTSNRAVGRIVTIAKGGASSDMAFVTENSGVRAEKLRITAAGNVGIGTDSPTYGELEVYRNGVRSAIAIHEDAGTAEARLHLRRGGNDTYIQTDGSGFNIRTEGNLSSGNAPLAINNTGNVTLGYDLIATGNVGIGTTSPAYKLQIDSIGTDPLALNVISTAGTSDQNAIRYLVDGVIKAQVGVSVDDGRILVGSTADDYLIKSWGNIRFGNGSGTSTVTIANGGNVGIGTTSPAAKLHSKGEIRVDYNDTDGSTYVTGYGIEFERNTNYLRPRGADGTQILHFGSANDSLNWNNINFKTSSHSQFRVAGSDIMRINSTGVGIGTTSPGGPLHIVSSGNDKFIRIENTSSYTGIWMNDSGTNSGWLVLSGYTNTTSPGDFAIREYGVQTSLTIKQTTGNVGIGTTSPTHRLTVAGGNVLMFPLDNTRQLSFYNDSYGITASSGLELITGDYIRFRQGSTELARLTTTGLGIGTTAPQKRLEVISGGNDFVSVGVAPLGVGNWAGIHFGYRESNTSYRKSAIVFERTDLTSNDAQGKIHILNGPQGSSGSATLADAKLTIAENGNVGIGTTSPGSRLDIIKEDGGQQILRVRNFATSATGTFTGNYAAEIRSAFTTGATGGALLVHTQEANDTRPVMAVSDSNGIFTTFVNGKVGIGTSNPVATLDINGNLYFSKGVDPKIYAGSGVGLNIEGELLYLNRYTGSNISMVMGGGNVGIGTTTPGKTLDITGEIRTSGRATFNEYVNTSFIYGNTDLTLAYAGGTSGILINSSGNVGIGTTNPTTKLYVDAGESTFNRGNSDGAIARFRGKNAEQAVIGTVTSWFDSNVGIGTTSPGYKLHVSGDAYISTSLTIGSTTNIAATAWLQFNGANVLLGEGTNTFLQANGAGSIIFRNNAPSELMRITSAGNVGIGTSSPSLESAGIGLDILNSSYTQLRVRSSSSSAGIEMTPGSGKRWEIQANTSSKWFVYDRTDGLYRLLIDTAGNVGIGTTSPSGILDVQNNNSGDQLVRFWNTNTGGTGSSVVRIANSGNNNNGSRLEFTDSSYYVATISADRTQGLVFRTSATGGSPTGISERVRITSAGNVGIGTTAPANKLVAVSDAIFNSENSYAIAAAAASDPAYKTVIGYSYANDIGLIAAVRTGIGWRNLSIPQGSLGIGTLSPSTLLHVNGVITATGGTSTNWNTAYSWGNHAGQYLPITGGTVGGPVTINGPLVVNGTITENSSAKIKENVETSEGNLEKVVNLRPVTYNKIGSQNTELGLIAEEVANVYPEFVQYDENGEPVGVHYSRLTAALIGAVKELNNRLEKLENK